MRNIFAALFVVLFYCLGLFASQAMAEGATKDLSAKDLNVAVVPVADRSHEALQKVLPQALGQVFIKMSGHEEVTAQPAIKNVLPKAEQLLQSYRYITTTDASTEAAPTSAASTSSVATPASSSSGSTSGPSAEPASNMQVELTFNRNALIAILQKAHQTIVSLKRPLTLVWINIPGGDMISSGSDSPLSTAVSGYANERGLPILLPEMDLQDQSMIALGQDQALMDLPGVNSLELRYGVKSVLVGQFQQGGDSSWQVHWQFWRKDQPQQWSDQGGDVKDMVMSGIDKTMSLLAGNPAGNPTANTAQAANGAVGKQQVSLWVSGISGLSDYSQVLRNLRRLPGVSRVSVSRMNPDSLVLKVEVQGGEQALVSELDLDQNFRAEAVPTSQYDSPVGNLHYHWK